MLYQLHELKHAMMIPLRLHAQFMHSALENPLNPLSSTPLARTLLANTELIERATRRFEKPEFGLDHTIIDGRKVKITENTVLEKPFGRLLNFRRHTKRNDPQVLIVAPISGHYATLLRGTVEALLPHHNVFITDWSDAKLIPLSEGEFNLDGCIAYLREFMSLLGPDTHVIAVCQPAVPVLAAIALMASDNDPNQPLSMTLMGGPIDTRVSKTEVTSCAEDRDISWFEQNVIHRIPIFYPGAMRKVYPGFVQLSGFMSMNLDKHIGSQIKFYEHLTSGDGESAEKHREFYDEYMSVMDIPAEFYLQTVETVFQTHCLPRGTMTWKDPISGDIKDVRPQDIKRTALLTIEGELDDICARGQTTAAHDLCYSLDKNKQFHHFQFATGHYGIFNGKRWRQQIMPRIRNFIRGQDKKKDKIPEKDLKIARDIAPNLYNRETHGVVAVRRWIKEHKVENYTETTE